MRQPECQTGFSMYCGRHAARAAGASRLSFYHGPFQLLAFSLIRAVDYTSLLLAVRVLSNLCRRIHLYAVVSRNSQRARHAFTLTLASHA